MLRHFKYDETNRIERGKMDIISKIVLKLIPLSVGVRHAQCSMLFPIEDNGFQSSRYLISLALEAIRNAMEVSLDDISARMKTPPYYPNIWPGEHYKLLAGLMLVIKPRIVIEIGTGAGLSALSMKKYLPRDSKIITFDIIDWKSYSNSCLQKSDFKDGKLVQYVDDLSNHAVVTKYIQLLKQTNIIFIDAAKDGIMEQRLLDNFKYIAFHTKLLIIFDDIHVWNMLKIWRDISLPKLDLTSFGHWSGTGIVEWK